MEFVGREINPVFSNPSARYKKKPTICFGIQLPLEIGPMLPPGGNVIFRHMNHVDDIFTLLSPWRRPVSVCRGYLRTNACMRSIGKPPQSTLRRLFPDRDRLSLWDIGNCEQQSTERSMSSLKKHESSIYANSIRVACPCLLETPEPNNKTHSHFPSYHTENRYPSPSHQS